MKYIYNLVGQFKQVNALWQCAFKIYLSNFSNVSCTKNLLNNLKKPFKLHPILILQWIEITNGIFEINVLRTTQNEWMNV